MILEMDDKEREIIKHILEFYIGELREEIVKTEYTDWKPPLHEEEELIKKIIQKLS